MADFWTKKEKQINNFCFFTLSWPFGKKMFSLPWSQGCSHHPPPWPPPALRLSAPPCSCRCSDQLRLVPLSFGILLDGWLCTFPLPCTWRKVSCKLSGSSPRNSRRTPWVNQVLIKGKFFSSLGSLAVEFGHMLYTATMCVVPWLTKIAGWSYFNARRSSWNKRSAQTIQCLHCPFPPKRQCPNRHCLF